jgi:CRISPR/Cas system-associated endonuclease Cas1
MLIGRLGLETARLPHSDRHGLVYLDRGRLTVEDGALRFRASGSPSLECGDYTLPHQSVSIVLLGPGSMVSHDALRLLARHVALAAVGEDGVRLYTAPPLAALMHDEVESFPALRPHQRDLPKDTLVHRGQVYRQWLARACQVQRRPLARHPARIDRAMAR